MLPKETQEQLKKLHPIYKRIEELDAIRNIRVDNARHKRNSILMTLHGRTTRTITLIASGKIDRIDQQIEEIAATAVALENAMNAFFIANQRTDEEAEEYRALIQQRDQIYKLTTA